MSFFKNVARSVRGFFGSVHVEKRAKKARLKVVDGTGKTRRAPPEKVEGLFGVTRDSDGSLWAYSQETDQVPRIRTEDPIELEAQTIEELEKHLMDQSGFQSLKVRGKMTYPENRWKFLYITEGAEKQGRLLRYLGNLQCVPRIWRGKHLPLVVEDRGVRYLEEHRLFQLDLYHKTEGLEATTSTEEARELLTPIGLTGIEFLGGFTNPESKEQFVLLTQGDHREPVVIDSWPPAWMNHLCIARR